MGGCFKIQSALTACAVLLFVTAPVAADTVLLQDGQSLYGNITAESSASVTIETRNGKFTFARDKIKRITRESVHQNQVRDLERFVAQGSLDTAIAFYRGSNLKENLTKEQLHSALLAHLTPVAVGIVVTSGTASMLADQLASTINPPAELLVLTAALCADTKSEDQALQLLRKLELNIPSHFTWPPETVAALLDRIASRALADNNGALLAVAANLAARLPLPPATKASDDLAVFSTVEELTRRKQYLSAASLFKPDLFLRRADLFIPLGERYVAAILAAPPSDETLAALESARVTVLPFVNKEVSLRALKVLVNRLLADGRREEAQGLVDSYGQSDPDQAALLQHLVEFQKRRAALDQNKPMDSYKLAAWARSMGLLEEAKSIFVTLRNDPRFAETVNLQISLIDHAQAEEAVARLRHLYDTDDLDRLKAESDQFLRTAPPEAFAQQARDLVQLADFQTWSNQRNSHGKAEAEFQHAERLANRREYDDALIHLNRIQLDREDSAAALKAQALRDKIMKEKLKEARSAAKKD